MAQTQKKLAQNETGTEPATSKRQLDAMGTRIAKNLVLFHPSEAIVTDLMAKARLKIPGLAETSQVLKVLHHNRECMFAVARKSRFNPDAPEGEGFIFMLPLTALGMQVLALDLFDGTHPDLRLVAGPRERPAGIYMWGVFLPGPLAAGLALFMDQMTSEQYAGLSVYARPVTEDGRRFSEVLGLTLGTTIGKIEAPNVWVFPRPIEQPAYDTYVPGSAAHEIGVTIARTLEDLNRVNTIRSAVYIGEQECPYDEEYDGNDLVATHLLAYIGDEPVGCLRVRFFADFAKIERLAIRKEFRKSRAAFQLVRGGFKLCQKKGYTRVYGHSQVRLVNFWSRFGFRVMEGGRNFVFSDFDYVEIVAEIDRDPDAITIGSDPYAIIRPEGRWHKQGILEHSAVREATQPSVEKKKG